MTDTVCTTEQVQMIDGPFCINRLDESGVCEAYCVDGDNDGACYTALRADGTCPRAAQHA